MENSEIREIDAADLTSCARLHAKVYGSPPWNDGWTEAKSEEYLGQLLGIPGSFGKVFVVGGDICGVVIGRQKVWWNNDEICVEELFVDLGCVDKRDSQISRGLIQGFFFGGGSLGLSERCERRCVGDH